MEEDIKILEEYIEWVKREGVECCAMEKELPAIENLIKGYRELEKENSKIREANSKLYEVAQGRAVQEILSDTYIPKSKIKEKIEELDKLIIETQKELGSASKEFTIYVYQEQVLQQLMEDK